MYRRTLGLQTKTLKQKRPRGGPFKEKYKCGKASAGLTAEQALPQPSQEGLGPGLGLRLRFG
ncbi:MAG: hypothetical protein AB1327_11760, partial [Bacillota bacterium]